MNKKLKFSLIAIFSILLIAILLYYWAFFYSFKKFAGQENWRPIKEYALSIDTSIIEQKIRDISVQNKNVLLLSDSTDEFNHDGWFTIFIISSDDTTKYIFGIVHNLSSNQMKSSIRLFHIISKDYDINPNSIKNINSELLKIKLNLFETALLNNMK